MRFRNQYQHDRSRYPSVGVIVPNHSRIESLSKTLQSVSLQDYAGEIHVYLVYLQRPEIARLIEQLGAEIRAIPTSVKGLGAKRNVGLDASTEDLIAFVDDDDLWHPAKVRLQVDALIDSGAIACCTRYVSFTRAAFLWPEKEGASSIRALSEREIAFSSTIAVSSMMSDGRLLRSLRFTERVEWGGVEDLHLWLRLQKHGQLVCLEKRLTALCIDHTSMSARGYATQELHALNVLADWYRGGRHNWVSKMALVRRTIDSAIARPGADDKEDLRILLLTYDGNLIGGHIDKLVVTLVRACWGSRIILPTLRWMRRIEYALRIKLMPRPPVEFADAEAREAQWGREH